MKRLFPLLFCACAAFAQQDVVAGSRGAFVATPLRIATVFNRAVRLLDGVNHNTTDNNNAPVLPSRVFQRDEQFQVPNRTFGTDNRDIRMVLKFI